jgi:UDP-N-acetylmuramyl pentapeptide synthase
MTALSSDIFRPKRLAKRWLCNVFEKQVVELRQRQPQVKFVAVVGSMGKTSTKLALAHTLEATGLRVQYQAGNYNDR